MNYNINEDSIRKEKPLLEVKDITKVYRVYNKSIDRLKEIFLKRKYHKESIVNNKISFSLSRGETVGIIGLNGAGKSTLLKIIAGVIEPTAGEIIRRGKVTALLELGTGFNDDMSGYENIFLNGTLIGMSESEIREKIDDIIEFSELKESIHDPIRTYSSGMRMRLAFSIAIFSEPEIFIVDEALSVGDAHFSLKCTRALKEKKERRDMGIIYVSHDLNSLKILCDRVILLDRGVKLKEGKPEEVINLYNMLIAGNRDKKKSCLVDREGESYGNFLATIESVKLRGEESNSNIVSAGERATIYIDINSKSDLEGVNIGFLIRDKFGQDIFGTNSYYMNKLINLEAGKRYRVSFSMDMNIGIGKYSITVALTLGENHSDECIHWMDFAEDFKVIANASEIFIGVAKLKPTFRLENV
jgi:lipopolysaccharide transport system ATP-binding protein